MTQVPFRGPTLYLLPSVTLYICCEPICGSIDELPALGGEQAPCLTSSGMAEGLEDAGNTE